MTPFVVLSEPPFSGHQQTKQLTSKAQGSSSVGVAGWLLAHTYMGSQDQSVRAKETAIL